MSQNNTDKLYQADHSTSLTTIALGNNNLSEEIISRPLQLPIGVDKSECSPCLTDRSTVTAKMLAGKYLFQNDNDKFCKLQTASVCKQNHR